MQVHTTVVTMHNTYTINNTKLAAKCKEEDLFEDDLNDSKIVVSRVFPPRCVNNLQLAADCVAKKKK